MKKYSVITLFPEFIEKSLEYGIPLQAKKKKLFELNLINPRDVTTDTHHTVDDRPFGGGDGMVMLPEVLEKSLASVVGPNSFVVYLTPQGQPLDQEKVVQLSRKEDLVIICGRYSGIDQRFVNNYVDEEISIGDYVLSGAEPAALVLLDAMIRWIPGALGHSSSAEQDSFSLEGGGLEAPVFTKPREFLGQQVPEVLLSGNHLKIETWKRQVGLLVTLQKRPDLLLNQELSPKQVSELYQFWQDLGSEQAELLGIGDLNESDFAFLGWEVQ